MRAIDGDKLREVIEKNFGHTGGAAVLMQLIDAQDTIQTESQWIPVTEQLPKNERQIYWCCEESGYQFECRWTNNILGIRESDRWGWSIFDVPQYSHVVAWMPLPEPYEVTEHGRFN